MNPLHLLEVPWNLFKSIPKYFGIDSTTNKSEGSDPLSNKVIHKPEEKANMAVANAPVAPIIEEPLPPPEHVYLLPTILNVLDVPPTPLLQLRPL